MPRPSIDLTGHYYGGIGRFGHHKRVPTINTHGWLFDLKWIIGKLIKTRENVCVFHWERLAYVRRVQANTQTLKQTIKKKKCANKNKIVLEKARELWKWPSQTIEKSARTPLNRRPLVYLLDKPKQKPGGAILEHNDASSSASYKHVDMKEGKKEKIEEVEGMYRKKERKKKTKLCVCLVSRMLIGYCSPFTIKSLVFWSFPWASLDRCRLGFNIRTTGEKVFI